VKHARLLTVMWSAAGVLVFVGVMGTIVDWLWQGHLVRRSIASVYEHFPIGMPFAEAVTRVQHDYPKRYTDTTADICAKQAAMTTPKYSPQGGPCIIALDETGSTWWGFESVVQLRLLFDSNEKLRVIQAYPVYTFL
jgi:hypothetical protein